MIVEYLWMKMSQRKMSQISEIALSIPKFGTLDPVTKVTSDDVTMMTSWWNTSGMFRMSKISDMLRHHDVINQ